MSLLPPPSRRPRARRVAALAALALASAGLSASPAAAAPPTNDAFANATPITLNAGGDGGTVAGTTVDATRESGEPQIRDETSGSVWYRITSPVTRPLVLDTCSAASFDTMLGVYTGASVNALTLVTNNDDASSDGCDNARSRVGFLAQANVTYFVQVDGYKTANGTFTLRTATGLLTPDVARWFNSWVNPRVNRLTFGDVGAAGVDTTCSLDGGAGQACALPYALASAWTLSDGPHEFKAQQSFGSLLSPFGTEAFVVDTVAPTMQVVGGPADGSTSAAAPTTWTATSSENLDVECVIDGVRNSCNVSDTGPQEYRIELPELCNGEHTFGVIGRDWAGNRGPNSSARRFTVTGGAACSAPAFTGSPSVGTDATAAWMNVPLSAAPGTRHHLEYGPTPGYGSRSDDIQPLQIGNSTGYANLDFLTPGTTYHARWVLENSAGTASRDFTFTTEPAVGPEIPVALLPVTERAETTATLTATTPSDVWSSARFEYGTSPSYGSTTPVNEGTGPVTAFLTGLQPRTTYHYRLVAVTDETRSETPDQTFTTGPDPVAVVPPVVVPPVVVPPVVVPPAVKSPTPQHPLTARIQKDLRASLGKVKLTRKGLRKGTKATFKLKTRTAGVTRLSGNLRRGKSKKSITVGTAKKANKQPTKKANTVVLKLPVGKKAKREAARKGKLTVTLKAQFTPGGTKQAITVTRKVTIK